jgi:hypothetical protein
MRIVYVLCCILISTSIAAQKKSSLTGIWTLYSISDPEMYYNVKADSFALKDISQFGAKDTAFSKQLGKALFGMFMKGSLEFGSDGSYTSYFNNEVESVGTYNADEIKKLLFRTVGRNKILVKDTSSFLLNGKLLTITERNTGTPLEMVFEKTGEKK